ncbi:hypothetical protein [Kineosporia sp. NBRC 101731]|uniref:hypothetical protein n=1 Tax=Kineosporia sp. NBRC 101731 TaxID=3032199 RepID=UPI002552ECC8|nr:hypothetical protein [Kineosporia sp. NBRC 101731]
MTTTGRPPRPDTAQPERLQSSTPLRELLNTMIGLLLGEISDGVETDRLRRYVDPLTMCLALDRDLDDQAGQARDAVSQVQTQQMSDLATGMIMARLGCDASTARTLLAAWLDKKRLEAGSLTPAEVKLLLEEPDLEKL